jgi:hypothetical protein
MKIIEDKDIEFPDRIRTLGKKFGGVKALAELSGIPYGTMQKYVIRKKPKDPSRSALLKIIEATECDAQWLITGIPSSEKEAGSSSATEASPISDHIVSIPKFSEKAYLDILKNATDFDTRNLLMKTPHSEIFQREVTYASKEVIRKIFGTDSPDVVAFDFEDARLPNSPVQVFVNLTQLKPKHRERVLVIHDGKTYLMRGQVTGSPPMTRLIDEAPVDPLPDFSFEQLYRDDAIIGTVLGAIVRR